MMHKSIAFALYLGAAPIAHACEITWDEPAEAGWIEGIRFYRDGTETGTASATPPADCAAVGVTPCTTCVYTARFYRGADESPESAPLVVDIAMPGGGRILLSAE